MTGNTTLLRANLMIDELRLKLQYSQFRCEYFQCTKYSWKKYALLSYQIYTCLKQARQLNVDVQVSNMRRSSQELIL